MTSRPAGRVGSNFQLHQSGRVMRMPTGSISGGYYALIHHLVKIIIIIIIEIFLNLFKDAGSSRAVRILPFY